MTVVAIVWAAIEAPHWLPAIGSETAEVQARAAQAQVVAAFLTLAAAVAAAVYARGAIDVAREAHSPRIHIDLQVVSAIDDSICLSIQATNYGGSGCVMRSVCSAFIAPGEVPLVLNGPPVSISLLPNERKEIGRVYNPAVEATGETNLVIVAKFEGPFLAKGAFATSRFEVSPQALINGQEFMRLPDRD